MSNIIDKIQLSGVTYDIGGGGGTVSSAITSGDTNAVAGGAVYDKFDEVEQVTAAALNDINDRVSEDEEVTAAALNYLNEHGGGGGGNPTVELTQAEYDALVTAGTVSADTYYIITDATPVDMSNYYTTAQTNTLLAGKQDTLTAGRGISISSNVVSFSLPISAGTGADSIIEGGSANFANGSFSHAEGYRTSAMGYVAHSEGYYSKAYGQRSHVEGNYTIANNFAEHASGCFNVSSSASTIFGNSGNTLFSVGNGTSDSARHNAFEIRQNGDIYLSSGGTDIKLQDQLGGGTVSSAITRGDTNAVAGGAVYDRFDEVEQVTAAALNNLNEALSGKQDTLSAGTNITIVDNVISAEGGGVNVVQTTGTSTADVMSQDAVTTQLNGKADKTTAARGLGYGNKKTHSVMYLTNQNGREISGYYYTLSLSKINDKEIVIQGDANPNTFSLVETSAITTSVTSASTDSQVPSAKAVNDKLGGLSLVKLTQTQYDNLQNKDSNTLYVIVN